MRKNILTILFISILIILILPKISLAATYYVSPNGTASWSQCTNIETPCSLATANDNAKAGDVVYLKSGVYTSDRLIDPKNSGTKENPIVFSAYNNANVIFNNQLVPNYNHEYSPWFSLNGAAVEHNYENSYSGLYSTKFTASKEYEGIKSENFTLRTHSMFSLWVYSDQSKVNVYIQRGDGLGPVVDKDFDIIPNQWNRIGKFFPSSEDPGYGKPFWGSNAYIAIRAPQGMTGTWYVDDVRIHSHGYSAINLDGDDYIKINGITVENTQRGLVIWHGSDYNEVSNCRFTNIQNGYYTPNWIFDGWYDGDLPSTNNWIHDNIFFENGYVVSAAPEDCDDIVNPFRIGMSSSGSRRMPDRSGYNLIENNTFYSGGHDLIIISTSNNVIRNNIFHNEGWIKNKIGRCQDSDGDPSTYNDVDKFGNRNVLFENPYGLTVKNLLEGNRIGFAGTPPDDDGANGIEIPTDENIIRYNFIFGNGASGIYLKQQNGNPDYNRIYHNTIYKNGGGDDIDSGYQSGIKYNCYLTNPVGNVIKNNILFDNIPDNLRRGSCSENVVYNINSYINNFEQNPFFINPDMSNPFSNILPDLSLQSNSPAIDGGSHLTVAKGSGSNSTKLIVEDALYFQDGKWGSDLARGVTLFPDWIAIGTVNNVVQIESIDYSTNTITLSLPMTWQDGDRIWLYKKSDGQRVLYGSAPDYGAYEYVPSTDTIPPSPPRNLTIN